MNHLLLTGFEPFADHASNPSASLAERLDGATVADFFVRCAILPVTAAGAPRALHTALEETQPDLVLSLGLAGGRTALALERVAINVLDFSIPDNAGYQPAEESIVPDGPAAYFSTLPLRAIVAAWRAAGIPGYLSNTAGTYVCNQILYESLHAARGRYRAGFIHLPCTPDLALARPERTASMSLDLIERGVRIALETAIVAMQVATSH